MPEFRVVVKARPNIKSPAFSDVQMRGFGQKIVDQNRERAARSINVFDEPAKPLSERYARRKQRLGRRPVRDLRLSGNMLGSLGVTEASSERVKTTVRGATPYRKGIFNQNIDPWFGISPSDEGALLADMQNVFGQNVKGMLG